jgi:glycosyltransferase involved in cell wall biosynthesis
MKTRLAIWTHGGIGGGYYSQGQPCIQELVIRLSDQYEIEVYSLFPANDDFVAGSFKIFSLNKKIKWNIFRWSYLIQKFLRRHFSSRYQILYAFWGYPSGPLVVLLSRLFGCESVIHLQGGDSACIPELDYGVLCNPIKKKACMWAYANASTLICLTNFQKDNLLKLGITREILVIPYGPDTRVFTFANGKFQTDVVKFIHIANHTPVKDQKMLLDTFVRINNKQKSHLKIIGFDALKGQIKRYAHQLGLKTTIEFIEPVPHHKIADYLAEADVILQTSLYEGQGIAMAEAAACGVLLAGTRVGLLSDLGDEAGILSSVGNSTELSNKILLALSQKELLQNCIDRSHQWIEDHDAEWTLRSIKSELQKLTDE